MSAAANAALLISASTVGLAIGVIPWSAMADRIGRVKAISDFGHRRHPGWDAGALLLRRSHCFSPVVLSKV